MRDLRRLFARLAVLALALPACSQGSTSTSNCGSQPNSTKDVTVTPDVACTIAQQANTNGPASAGYTAFSPDCAQACGSVLPDGGIVGTYYRVCTLSPEYSAALEPLVDAGLVPGDAGDDAGARACPTVTGPVGLHCSVDCTGRRTASVADLVLATKLDAGAYFAAAAYLEETSAHAFACLALELEAHGAPRALIASALRAEQEEIRHTEITTRLALRFGASPARAERLPSQLRSLFDVALENAIEGCVRETYGAALAVLRAEQARDPEVRAALHEIAEDECRHAELSWEIAAWAHPRLSATERATLARRMREAVDALVFHDDQMTSEAREACVIPAAAIQRRLAELLDEHVFRVAA